MFVQQFRELHKTQIQDIFNRHNNRHDIDAPEPTMTLDEMHMIQMAGFTAYLYPRRKVITVSGWRNYKLVE